MGSSNISNIRRKRRAIVLSGGGSRGAYEAGVLSRLFEDIYPKMGEDFEFDIISGTSVGAIHAAYIAASGAMNPRQRSQRILDTWLDMSLDTVLELRWWDLLAMPLRASGWLPRKGRSDGSDQMASTFGGLVDVTPLEKLVASRVPWAGLRPNLDAGRPGVLCVAVTEVMNGQVKIFMDGNEADTRPWDYDRNVDAVKVQLGQEHVRASAAIPFLFPAVRVDDCYYVDGGLRLNTPLSPAVRLQADNVLVIGLKHLDDEPSKDSEGNLINPRTCDIKAMARPAYVMGKLLDVILLDPIENELRQLDIINSLIDGGRQAFGDDFSERLAPFIEAKRGVNYRPVETLTLTPSQDLGAIAATTHSLNKRTKRSFAASIMTRSLTSGIPDDEADFLSYVYFDNAYTKELVELGRDDAKKNQDAIMELLCDGE